MLSDRPALPGTRWQGPLPPLVPALGRARSAVLLLLVPLPALLACSVATLGPRPTQVDHRLHRLHQVIYNEEA